MVEDKGDLPRVPAEEMHWPGGEPLDVAIGGSHPDGAERPPSRELSRVRRRDRDTPEDSGPSRPEEGGHTRVFRPGGDRWVPGSPGRDRKGAGPPGPAKRGRGRGGRGPGRSRRKGPPATSVRVGRTRKPTAKRPIQWRVLLWPTSVAAILLTLTFVLGVVNAFLFTPSGADIERPGDIFSESSATLAGKVFDRETGVALPDVDVSLVGTGISTTTNNEGWYFMDDLTVGEYTLRAELDGYGTVTRKITFESFLPDTQDIDMQEGGDPVEEDMRSPLLDPPSKRPEVVGYLMGVLSVPPLLAAVFCMRRERFIIALAGAVLGCFSLGFGVGSGLSLAAVVLILLARERFAGDGEGAVGDHGPGGGDRPGRSGGGPRRGREGPIRRAERSRAGTEEPGDAVGRGRGKAAGTSHT